MRVLLNVKQALDFVLFLYPSYKATLQRLMCKHTELARWSAGRYLSAFHCYNEIPEAEYFVKEGIHLAHNPGGSRLLLGSSEVPVVDDISLVRVHVRQRDHIMRQKVTENDL